MSDEDSGRSVTESLARAPAIILYGAGNLGRETRGILAGRGWTVRCFLDRNVPEGGRVDGLDVRIPTDQEFDDRTRQETPVVVSIFNPDVEIPQLLADLRQQGWKSVISFVEFHRAFATELGDRFWLTDLKFYAGHAGHLRAASALWADRASESLYEAILRCRIEADLAALLAPDLAHQYFPPDLPPWSVPCRFVDCGAFDGDTLRQIDAAGFALEAVAAFEPDPVNLRRLSVQVAASARRVGTPQILVWPCAVAARTEQLRFDMGHGAASGLLASGPHTVQAVALDDALAGFRPTLIKMDIEGAECDALLGARGIIERDRPGLAVCVYHRPQDLWQIPLLIQSWGLGYRFYLRAHRYNGFDVVLYAQPDPRSESPR